MYFPMLSRKPIISDQDFDSLVAAIIFKQFNVLSLPIPFSKYLEGIDLREN